MAALGITACLVFALFGKLSVGQLTPIEGGLPDYEYFVSTTESRKWYEAQEQCVIQLGGGLMEITDLSVEMSVITKANDLNRGMYAWVGASRLESDQWSWLSGAAVDDAYWERNFPTTGSQPELCAAIHYSHAVLLSRQCSEYGQYLCKRRRGVGPDPTRDPTPDTPIKGDCPPGFYGIGAKCYRLFPEQRSWEQASLDCQALRVGSRPALASFQDDVENAAVTAQLGSASPGYWIGLYRPHYWWFWTDNSPNTYFNWLINPGMSVGCAYVKSEKGLWSYTMDCQLKKSYICQTYRVEDSTNTSAPTPDDRCEDGYTYYRDSCYRFFPTPLAWDEAREGCEGSHENGSLASIHSYAENAYLFLTLSELQQPAWTGLFKTLYAWQWSDGSEVTMMHFTQDLPQPGLRRRCAEMREDGYWYSIGCNETRPYLCRIPLGSLPQPPENSDGECPPNHGITWQSESNTNFCYAAKLEEVDWQTAMYACARAHTGSHLVSIHSLHENDIVRDLTSHNILTNSTPWLGFIRSRSATDYTFAWVDGSVGEFTHWREGYPRTSGACVAAQMLVGEQGTDSFWEDIDCRESYPYVCKVPKGPHVSFPEDAGGFCPSEQWERFGNHCLLFNILSTHIVTWADARAECRALGADLVQPNDKHVNGFLKEGSNHASPIENSFFWIGLRRPAQGGDFLWVDTMEKPTYEAWSHNNEPGNDKDCVVMKVASTEWYQSACDQHHGYVCQKLQDMDGSGITQVPDGGGSGNDTEPNPGHPSKAEGLNDGEIAGIVIGVLLLVALVVVAVLAALRYKDRLLGAFGKEKLENEA